MLIVSSSGRAEGKPHMHFKAAGCRGSVGDYVAFWQVQRGQAVPRCLCASLMCSVCVTLCCAWMVLRRCSTIGWFLAGFDWAGQAGGCWVLQCPSGDSWMSPVKSGRKRRRSDGAEASYICLQCFFGMGGLGFKCCAVGDCVLAAVGYPCVQAGRQVAHPLLRLALSL